MMNWSPEFSPFEMSLSFFFFLIPVQALIKFLAFVSYILSPSSGLYPEHCSPVKSLLNISFPILFLPQNLAGILHWPEVKINALV